MQKAIGRFRPRHPLLGAAASRIALPFTELFFVGSKFIGHRVISQPSGDGSCLLNLREGKPPISLASVSEGFTTAVSL